MRILLIESYPQMARALKRGLEEDGFSVDVVLDGASGGFHAEVASYDAIILDLAFGKGDGDGLSLLTRWRGAGVPAHIMVLTASGGVDETVAALDMGADDCMTKPFGMDELLARLRAMNRRRPNRILTSTLIKVFDLEINTDSRAVRRAGREIRLTPREYALLEFLASRKGKVVSRSMILEQLYDEDETSLSNVVDVYIKYLRNKIDKEFSPPLILTRRGVGYMLRAE